MTARAVGFVVLALFAVAVPAVLVSYALTEAVAVLGR